MISFITVNYNSSHLIKKLFKSLKNYLNSNFELIVIDNDSNASEKLLLEELNIHENISVIFNKSNLGFGRACNIGVELASSEIIILINPDVELIQDGLEAFIKQNLSVDVGVLAPRILNEDLSIQPNGGGFTGLIFYILYSLKNLVAINKFKKVFKLSIFKKSSYTQYIKNFEDSHDSSENYDWVSGAFMIINKNIFNKINGFDRNFFMYTEDKDLCFQIKNKLKMKIIVNSTYKVVHSVGGTQEKKFNPFMEVIKMKSRIYYLYKNSGITKAIVLKYFYSILVLLNKKFKKEDFYEIFKYKFNHDSTTIVGYYGSGNIGDECILHALLNEYKKTSNIVLSNNVYHTKKLHLLKAYPKKSIKSILISLANTNQLIIGGGGLFLKSNTSTYIYMYMIAKLFKLLGKNVYIDGIGLNYEALDSLIHKHFFLKLIKISEYVKVRDRFSYDYISDCYETEDLNNLFLRNDFVFDYLNRWKKENVLLQKEKILGVSLMNIDVDFSNITNFIRVYAEKKFLIKFYLFFKNENDDSVVDKIIEKLDYLNIEVVDVILNKNEDFNNLFLDMSKNEVFLSMRFHPMLISHQLDSKVFVVPHNSKIKDFAKKYNIGIIQ